MNEYKEAYESFNNLFEDGLILQAHSGLNSEPEIIVYNAKDFFDHDEIMANEDFSNFLDRESLEPLITLQDCFDECIYYVLEEQILDSFFNGQNEQAIDQLNSLLDPSDFFDYLEGQKEELKILRILVKEGL